MALTPWQERWAENGIVWSYLDLLNPPYHLWVQQRGQYFKQGGDGESGSSGKGVCQGPGSLLHLFDLAPWWENLHQETALFLAISINSSISQTEAAKKKLNKINKKTLKTCFVVWQK